MTFADQNEQKDVVFGEFKTKSGSRLKIGTGTGTKWQWIKKARPEDQQDQLVQELVDQIDLALQLGFRHIDTAETYTTHPEVGAAMKQSKVSREEIFLTSKYNPGFPLTQPRSDSPLDAVNKALEELETDYIDLFLLHSPFYYEGKTPGSASIEAAWKSLMEAKKQGKVRYIGVSNFATLHLQRILAVSEPGFEPQVNQVEFHPYLQNQSKNVVSFCQERGILVEAFGPLTPLFRIDKNGSEVKDHPLKHVLPHLLKKYGKTDAQILLRYTLQRGILPITTSSKEQRIKESLAVYEFELDPQDVELIDKTGSEFHFRAFFGDLYDNL